MGSALETLFGQTYGAKHYHLLGIHVQTAIFTLFCMSIPLAIVWNYMHTNLIAFGQDPLISFKAGKFARWLILSLFAYIVLQPRYDTVAELLTDLGLPEKINDFLINLSFSCGLNISSWEFK
ncbi:hypothetical protein SUGI_0475270 [Cryptomeria japonica]|nr:hypothetical protein SUGI_0475270 [Cryptomeria japonica]